MPAPFDRDRFTQQIRFSLGTMLVLTVAYAGFVFLFFPAKAGAGTSLAMELALLILGILLLGGGIFAWFRVPSPKLMALSARKLGKAEREKGWPPRAEALRKRFQLILMLLQSAAIASVLVIAIGSLRLVAALLLAAVIAAVLWFWKQLPRKVREVL